MSLLFPFTTLSFAFPLAFLLPFILGAALLFRKARPGVSIRSIDDAAALRSWRAVLAAPTLAIGAIFGVLFLTIAAARPQRVTILPALREARNLMVVVDVSRSMEIDDFSGPLGSLSRMDAIKLVLSEFIRQRKGDRIGIVVFGQQAFLQSPLTTDTDFLLQLIDQLQPRMAGDGTAMGEGLGVGLRRIEDVRSEARVLILITDGVSNAGSVNPLQAAQVARDLSIAVHTIGIGSYTPVAIGPFGGLLGGGPARTEFDEEGLQEIARITSGIYRNASTLSGLQDIYREIDRVERTKEEEPEKRLVQELFPHYLALAFILFSTTVMLSRTIFLRVP